MLTFLKAQMSSLIATSADWLISVLLVQLTGSTPAMAALATAEGAACGGIINFFINRTWVFNGGQNRTRVQMMRYLLVWTGSLLLNTTCMYLVIYFTNIPYAGARIFVSVLVGVTYNYFLQKKFVFK